jgi:hypothetical protein
MGDLYNSAPVRSSDVLTAHRPFDLVRCYAVCSESIPDFPLPLLHMIDGHNDRLDMGTAPPFPRRFATDSADQWPDHVRFSDLEARFVCKACGKRGADVRPDFNWNKNSVAAMGYR